MSFLSNSHLVLTTKEVSVITDFWRQLLEQEPHFENKGFAEFVLNSDFALPFPANRDSGKTFFSATMDPRDHCGIGITVKDIDAVYARCTALHNKFPSRDAGAPKSTPGVKRASCSLIPMVTAGK